MKKLLILVAAISAVIVSAKAEMLYWQVDTANYGIIDSSSGQSTLWYESGDTLTRLATANGLTQGVFDTGWNTSISDYETADYWIEVGTYDSSGNLTEGSYFGAFKYSDLANAAGGLSAANMRAAAASANMSNSGHVPEPTSGLMMIVGMALLGLKRRRV